MDIVHPLGVLGSECGRRSHGVAAMGGDDLLVRLKATDVVYLQLAARLVDGFGVRVGFGRGW